MIGTSNIHKDELFIFHRLSDRTTSNYRAWWPNSVFAASILGGEFSNSELTNSNGPFMQKSQRKRTGNNKRVKKGEIRKWFIHIPTPNPRFDLESLIVHSQNELFLVLLELLVVVVFEPLVSFSDTGDNTGGTP